MTNNVYRTAQGKLVDIGALQLKNEHVKAVGNMGVNARGDRVDETNRVIDTRASQVQRQIKRQTNVVAAEVQPTSLSVKRAQAAAAEQALAETVDTVEELAVPAPVVDTLAVAPAPVAEDPTAGGLAGALARAKSK